MHQPNTPGWPYPNQYNPYPHSYDYNFQNNFNSSQSHWGFTYPESNSQIPCPPYSPCPQYSFPDFTSYTPFSGPPIKEKSEFQKRIEANIQENEQQLQEILASLKHIQESCSVPPPYNEQPFALETSKELLCESKLQSPHIFDSHSSQNFQNQDSYTPILEQPFGDTSSLDRSMDILQESLLQYQKSHAESVNRVEE